MLLRQQEEIRNFLVNRMNQLTDKEVHELATGEYAELRKQGLNK